MPNRATTQKLITAFAKHGDVVEEQLEGLLEARSILASDLDLSMVLEHDFGPDWRGRVERISDEAMEAIITSGTFNKMIQSVIRTTLREEPKEMYKLSRLVPMETKGECEGAFKDYGVFSDPQAHEVCELEAPPLYGVATDYLGHPTGKMAGVGMAWTREALCRDPNGFLAQQVAKLRDAHDEYKENKLIDTFIGYLPTYNRTGTLYDTYYEDGTATPFDTDGPWVNASDNRFFCVSDLTEVKEMFWDMTDMVHGREIQIDTDNLQVVTSKQEANRMRPLLMSQALECESNCAGQNSDCKYIMTAEVANGVTFDLTAYSRFVDRIVLRYGVTRAEAQNWWWVGKIPEFIAWVSQIRPEVNRCPLGAEECRKRIVVIYNSLSKGYAYIRDPHKGIMMTGAASESV